MCSSNGNTIKATFVAVRILISSSTACVPGLVVDNTEKLEVVLRLRRIFLCAELVEVEFLE